MTDKTATERATMTDAETADYAERLRKEAAPLQSEPQTSARNRPDVAHDRLSARRCHKGNP
jgi:hypothetical protein